MSIIFDLSTYVATSMISTGTRAVTARTHHRERFQVDERYRINGGPKNEIPMALDLHAQ